MDGIGASFISHVWPLCFHGSSWERLPDPRPSQTTWRDRTCVLGAHCETCNTDTETKTSPRGPGRCLERPHPGHSTLVAESHHWYLDPRQTLQISAIQLFWKVSSLWEGFINRHISFVCGMTWHDFTQLVQLIHAICYIIGVCATSRRRIYFVRILFVHLCPSWRGMKYPTLRAMCNGAHWSAMGWCTCHPKECKRQYGL